MDDNSRAKQKQRELSSEIPVGPLRMAADIIVDAQVETQRSASNVTNRSWPRGSCIVDLLFKNQRFDTGVI
jgi:hypothetical protein